MDSLRDWAKQSFKLSTLFISPSIEWCSLTKWYWSSLSDLQLHDLTITCSFCVFSLKLSCFIFILLLPDMFILEQDIQFCSLMFTSFGNFQLGLLEQICFAWRRANSLPWAIFLRVHNIKDIIPTTFFYMALFVLGLDEGGIEKKRTERKREGNSHQQKIERREDMISEGRMTLEILSRQKKEGWFSKRRGKHRIVRQLLRSYLKLMVFS